jgi:hypothetical protein
MEPLPASVKILSELFVVVYMLSVALGTTHGQIVATLRDFRLMGYALLANLIMVPVLGVILARYLDLPLEIRTGVLMLALAPGGLFALQCARVSQGNRVLAVGLLIVLSIVAVVGTPVLIGLFFPPAHAGKMPFAWLIPLLLLLIVAPLLVGRAFAPACARCRAKAWQAVGCAVDRALHHRSAHRWEVQNARAQVHWHGRDRGDYGLDPLCVGRRLAAGWVGDQQLQGASNQHQHAQRRGLLLDRRPLLPRHERRRPDPGLQRHFHPDEYAFRAHHWPHAARYGGQGQAGRGVNCSDSGLIAQES